MNWFKHLQHKWNVTLWGMIAIIIAFSLAGSSVVRIRPYVMHAILPEHAPLWLKTFTYILLIFPMYQILVLIYGTLLGQFRFFWDKEKRLLLFLKKIFTKH